MSGIILEAEARQHLESSREKLNVYKFINLLGSMDANLDYLFAYVRDIMVGYIADDWNGDCTKKARTADVDRIMLNFEDLLPKGVFAAWG